MYRPSLVVSIMLVALACGGRTIEDERSDPSSGGRPDGPELGTGGSNDRGSSDPTDEEVEEFIETVCTALPEDTCLGCLCQSCGSTAVGCALSAPCLDTLSCLVQSGCSGVDCLTVAECQPALLQLTEDPEALAIVMETLTCLGAHACPCDSESLPIAAG